MTSTVQTKPILLGTAGHIDHGKTSLVAKLSGINTDRLPEEKSRGISIDLGFAHWEAEGFRFGIVDVPGHERFVKNMVAGATGVNIGMLIVAADDGVMPQTREHLEIMDLLGLTAGVIVITKIDLVESDFVELVEAEVEDLVADSFLNGAPIVPVSSHNGEGFDQLRATLVEIAGSLKLQQPNGLFRLPVDRVFSIPGHGTVVTGSVMSGTVGGGDRLDLLPSQREIRVRGVQNHGADSDASGVRQRTAVNLASIKSDEVQRGNELATAGYLEPTRRLVVELRCLTGSPTPLKDRMELLLHLATSETQCRLVTKGVVLEPGQKGFAELRVETPIVATWGQRFILRRVSPAMTIGGGRILDPGIPAGRRIRGLADYATGMAQDNVLERLSFLISQLDAVPNDSKLAARRAGVNADEFQSVIDQLNERKELETIGSGGSQLLVHRDRIRSLAKSVMKTIREELARRQPRRSLARDQILSACRELAGTELLNRIIDLLVKQKELIQVGLNFGPADAQVDLTKKQRLCLTTIIESVTGAKLSPPTIKELVNLTQRPQAEVQQLINLSIEDGLLLRISKDLFFAPSAIDSARQICAEFLAEKPEGATMAEVRDALEVTRKFAVPLCEYFDSIGITVREDDKRRPGPNIDVVVE